MNPDLSSPDPSDPEARITALLLGELSPVDADAVQKAMTSDPELTRLHERLRQTIGLLREAVSTPAPSESPQTELPRLSSERRDALLARFKVGAVPEATTPGPVVRVRFDWKAVLPLALAAGLTMLLSLGALVPTFSCANTKARRAESNFAVLSRHEEEFAAAPAQANGRAKLELGFQELEDPARAIEEARQSLLPQDRDASLRARSAGENATNQARLRSLMRYGLAPRGAVNGPVEKAAERPAVQRESAPNVLQDYFARSSNLSAAKAATAWADYDNDGYLDLFAAESTEGVLAGSGGGGGGGFGGGGGGAEVGGVQYFLRAPAVPPSEAPANRGAMLAKPAVPESTVAESLEHRFGAAVVSAETPVAPGSVPASEKSEDNWGIYQNNGVGRISGGASLSRLDAAGKDGTRGGATDELAAVPGLVTMNDVTSLGRTPVLGDVPVVGQALQSAAQPASPAAGGYAFRRSETVETPAKAKERWFFDADPAAPTGKSVAVLNGAGRLLSDRDSDSGELASLPISLPVPAFMGEPVDLSLSSLETKADSGPTPESLRRKLDEARLADRFSELEDVAADSKLTAGLDKGLPQPSRRGRGVAVPVAGAAGAVTQEQISQSLDFGVENFSKQPVALAGFAAVKALPDLMEAEKRVGQSLRGDGTVELGTVDGAFSAPIEDLAQQVDVSETVQLGVPLTIAAPAAEPVVEPPAVTAAMRPPPVPQPEVATGENAVSTFSLNVADVSYQLAAASLGQGQMPEPAGIRTEEFINAFDYRDPEPVADAPIALNWERARYPFAHNRDLLRLSVQTAAQGREAGRPLNLVLLLDNSGSMERADRVGIIREALRVLADQLQSQDKISVVAFARNARLWVDGLAGSEASELPERVGNLTPEGGTNLEEAMKAGYETALRHFQAQGVNRVILLTDGAANLGDVVPESLQRQVEAFRRRGVALDCFGIGWEGYNDDLLEVLSRHGDGRYGFVNSPEEAATGFADQLAGALQVAAADVKVQVEFNPRRVTHWRQVGYARHQLTQEQFRDNTVDAAELGAAESGNAQYVVEVNPQGDGPLGNVRVRYRVPATGQYREQEWPLAYAGQPVALEQASPALRLAASASAFAEWLSSSPFATEVNSDQLLALMSGVPEAFDPDSRPKQLEWMIRQAKSLSGR
ncbi:MAG: YfbK domain-containing protein [Limisphaerales bacterium]